MALLENTDVDVYYRNDSICMDVSNLASMKHQRYGLPTYEVKSLKKKEKVTCCRRSKFLYNIAAR